MILLSAPQPLRDYGKVSLFLDLDGTLTPIVKQPSLVGPDDTRNRLLSKLGERLDGRLAIVSGREISEVDRILSRSVEAVAGTHGLERRDTAGELVETEPHPCLGDASAIFTAFAIEHSGVRVEPKRLSVALHYRNAPDACASAHDLARRLSDETGLRLLEGKEVVELLTPGHDKGDAITDFMKETPFAGGFPIFAGDDRTDEHGFVAVAEMGGFGILVGQRRESCATHHFDDPAALLSWLRAGVE